MREVSIREAMQVAVQNHQAGRLAEAEKIYREVLDRDPNNADAMHLLGMVAHQTGNSQAALEMIRRAIGIDPSAADFHNNLGEVCRALGRPAEAVACFERAIALQPDFAEAYNNLGNALCEAGRVEVALCTYRKAIEIRPDYAEAYTNLGMVLLAHGKYDDAIAAYRRTIELKPDLPEPYYNLGNALRDNRQLDEALAAFNSAIERSPHLALPHWNKSLLLLLKGEFPAGWAEYEWRWQLKDFPSPPWNFPHPVWRGEALWDRTILIHAEQGIGDTIQFARYVPLVAQRGARVILCCQQELLSLLRSLDGVHCFLAMGQSFPPFDLHVPMLSLPLAFGTTLQSIPAQMPYLKADPARVEAWRAKVAPHSPLHAPRLKVGLAWAGNPLNKTDRLRSMPLSALAPLGEARDVCFFSLQKGKGAEQAKNPPPGMRLVDLTEEIKDFADTAALMANLDLIVTVETAVAHLAGAAARPVWTLVPFVPAWQWMLDREDSPWYPTMRLFRQTAPGDWDSVVRRVVQELRQFSEERRER